LKNKSQFVVTNKPSSDLRLDNCSEKLVLTEEKQRESMTPNTGASQKKKTQ